MRFVVLPAGVDEILSALSDFPPHLDKIWNRRYPRNFFREHWDSERHSLHNGVNDLYFT